MTRSSGAIWKVASRRLMLLSLYRRCKGMKYTNPIVSSRHYKLNASMNIPKQRFILFVVGNMTNAEFSSLTLRTYENRIDETYLQLQKSTLLSSSFPRYADVPGR